MHTETLDPWELIDELCTHEPIADLLRKAKSMAKNDVLIGGTKQEAISSLRRAVDSGFVNIDEIWNLLRRCEENGNQHIFFYRLAKGVGVQVGQPAEKVGSALFGKTWTSMFPKFNIQHEGLVWSDFRPTTVGWIGKLYGWHHSRKLVKKYFKDNGVSKSEASGRIEIEEYSHQRTRQVCLAYWQNGLLQLRIPRNSSRAVIRNQLKFVWDRLAVAGLKPNMFHPVDFLPTKRRLLDESIGGSKAFRAHAVQCQDDDCTIEFRPSTEGDVLSSAAKHALLNSLSDTDCRDLVIRVFPVEDILPKDLLVQLAWQDGHNELVIAAGTTPEAIDYVTGTILQT